MKELSGGRVFDYSRPRQLFRNWGWLIINIVPLGGLLSPLLDLKNALAHWAAIPVWAHGLLLFGCLVGLWGYKGYVQKHQSILISSQGIYNRALRSEWRGIQWNEVERIKKVMEYHQDLGRDLDEIVIEGGGKAVLFRDYILCFDELKNALNLKANELAIPIICIDKRDTSLYAATDGLQSSEARQIHRTGVISELRAL